MQISPYNSFSVDIQNKVWVPFPGAQENFLCCPAWECLLHGNRGGGKTDVLLMDYLSEVGKGHGSDYRGLLLREATTELGDVIAKSLKWIPRIFPTAKFNKSRKIWTFEDGETLWLNYARTDEDYFQYHGHEYPWIGWEELTNHAVDTIYLKLMSCNRCSNKAVPIKYRATCNPSGPGHAWVKDRFVDTVGEGKIFIDRQEIEYPDEYGNMIKAHVDVSRTHLKSYASQNKALNEDPTYIAKIHTLTQNDDMLRKAWIEGSWDLVADSFFSDIWRRKIHVINEFELPKSWKIYRSFDWGSSKPWAVSYIAESNGEQPRGLDFYLPASSCIIINELYGFDGTPNVGDKADSTEIARRTLELDKEIKERYGIKVFPGPADTSIWEVRDGKSIGGNMSKAKLHWTRAYKGAGSRVAGWSLIRQLLGAAKRKELENPHLYFFRKAKHHIRTLPLMQRDELKPEDINTDMEDHCFVYETEVITDCGVKCIGDLVGKSGKILSVNGNFVRFTNCRKTRVNSKVLQVTFLDGHSVLCTPDHKFLTISGFIEAKNLLTSSDTFCIVSKIKENLLCEDVNETKGLLYFQKQNRDLMEKFTTNVVHIFKKMESGFIELFGNSIMARFLMDTISIIKRLLMIIKLKIWNLWMKNLICHCIPNKYQELQLNNVLKNQNSGMVVKKEKNGIKRTTKILKKTFIKVMTGFATIVEKKQQVKEKMVMHSVQTSVNQHGEGSQDLMMLKENVSYVPAFLQLTNIQNKKRVHVNADQNYVIGIKDVKSVDTVFDVYCLVANDTHSFALKNGVIVSNCMDSMRYGLAKKLTGFKRRKVRT